MKLTEDMQKAMDIIQNTNEHVFITGKAGTGKTTFLKHLVKNTGKKCVVAAPTGVAAIQAHGMTLHSLFSLPFHLVLPNDALDYKFTTQKKELLIGIDILIIDEISMVRPDILDTIDRKLRWVREDDRPFGGVQIVMFGDLFQLPPVIKSDDWKVLKDYYDDYFFFNALVFKQTGFHVIELNTIFRQTDDEFINVLNKIRDYQATTEELDMLGEVKDKNACNTFNDEYIHLCTHKREVDRINTENLGGGYVTFEAQIEGKFPDSSAPCDKTLCVRVGARVMVLVNNLRERYYNGSLGVVVAITDNIIKVKLDSGISVEFERYKWSNIQYSLQDDKVVEEEIGKCVQFPLTLAWAITIHKSQGLTFDKVALHISKTFCAGQLYVALSRCRSLEGIITDAFVTKKMIIPNYTLTDFERAYQADGNYYGRKVIAHED